jgi:hypothetical protein
MFKFLSEEGSWVLEVISSEQATSTVLRHPDGEDGDVGLCVQHLCEEIFCQGK